VLVFSSKKETAPLLKALSVEFKDKLKIGEVQEKQKDICSEFGVTEFPTIVTLQPDGSRVKYDDAIKHKKLQRAFADLVAKKGGSSSTGSSDEDAESSGENAKETANVFSPPESVIQLTSQAQFEDECLSKKGVCVIAFVDTYEVDDAKKFQMVLEKVRKEKHSLKLFSFFWADGTQLTEEFTRDIQVPGGFPSAVIVFPAKNRIAPYVGAFTADAMGKYLEKILRGTLRTSPYEKLPVMLGAPVERSAEEPEEPSHDEL
jgi:protein disulfide-isomerase A6